MADDASTGDARSLEAEAAVHLIRAGRELLSAAKAVIESLDAYLEVLEQRVATPSKPAATIQSIPIRRAERVERDQRV